MRTETIGKATLYLGDCRGILPSLRASVGAVVTDPPYGISWKRAENKASGSKAHDGIVGDDTTESRDFVLDLLVDVPAFVFGSFYAPYPKRLKQVLVWHKPADAGLVGSTTGYRRDVEPIFMVGPWPVKTVKTSGLLRSLYLGQTAIVKDTGHPHTKPVDLMESLVLSTHGTVLDPFMGSGTTGVACANLGRHFIGIEIVRRYFDMACKRIEAAHAQGRLFA